MTSRPRKSERDVQLPVPDVEGVLTDGRLHFGPRGGPVKLLHARDGLGITDAFICGRRSQRVTTRCRELGIRHVLQGVKDKVKAAHVVTEPPGHGAVGDVCDYRLSISPVKGETVNAGASSPRKA